MKKNGLKWIIKVIAACATVFCALSLFCVFFYNPPVHVAQENGATSYTREGNQFWSRMTEGVAHGRTDEAGYNNPEAMGTGEMDILMIGSSQAEGLYINADECASYLLNQRFAEDGSGLTVYNIGMSAHDLYRELQCLSDALETYQPTQYVFFEISFLSADPDQVDAALNDRMEELSYAEPGKFSYIIQKNPFVKAAYQQFSNYRETKLEEEWMAELDEELKAQMQIDDLTANEAFIWADAVYLQYIADLCSAYQCQPVIYYIPTMTIEDDGSLKCSADEASRQLYAQLCQERGILFADMTDAILQTYEEDHIVASGFVNTTVGFGHLNADGHRILCDVLYDAVAGREVAP